MLIKLDAFNSGSGDPVDRCIFPNYASSEALPNMLNDDRCRCPTGEQSHCILRTWFWNSCRCESTAALLATIVKVGHCTILQAPSNNFAKHRCRQTLFHYSNSNWFN